MSERPTAWLPYALPFDLTSLPYFPYRFPFELAGPPPVPLGRTWGIGPVPYGFRWWIRDDSSVLDYMFDWTSWLTSDDVLTDASVGSTGLFIQKVERYASQVIAWISGGVAGTDYDVTCRVYSSTGRTDERTAKIKVIPT